MKAGGDRRRPAKKQKNRVIITADANTTASGTTPDLLSLSIHKEELC